MFPARPVPLGYNPKVMDVYLTDRHDRFLRRRVQSRFISAIPEMRLVKVYPDVLFQPVIGFGGALTEAAGYVFSQMGERLQHEFIEACFGQKGNRYNLARTSIQSCDFSLGPRAYVEDATDVRLDTFSIQGDRPYVLPIIKAAQDVNPGLGFLASPWSPPAWAKTNGDMRAGGYLKHGAYDIWARMIARYLLAYREEGVDIGRITVQNEPQAKQTWESCLFNAYQEREFLCNHLRPALDEVGLYDVKILVWDHNKEGMYDRAAEFMNDPRAASLFDGVAFHWYSGDHFEAVRATRALIGDRELIFSEGCDAYSAGDIMQELSHAEHYAHELIGDLEAGANAFLDWNVLLDSLGGPNHVDNVCDAPVMYDASRGTLRLRLPYYYLGHFSRFIQPGARRMLVTRFTQEVETCGFVNPDGGKVLIVLNRTGHDIPFTLSRSSTVVERRIAKVSAPAHSIQTFCW